MKPLVIEFPYTIYTVPLDSKGATVSLSGNQLKRAGFGRGLRYKVTAGTNQLFRDATFLTYMALADRKAPKPPLYIDLKLRCAVERRRDDDNVWAGFKAGRDGLAFELGLNDSDLHCGTVMWEVGTPEGMWVTLRSRTS